MNGMAEKLKLTQEQAEAIEVVRTIIIPIEFANKLKGLSAADILQAIKEGYDIKTQFKVGDWVVRVSEFRSYVENAKYQNYRVNSVFRIQTILNSYAIDEHGTNHDLENIRHAIPEEIKREKERRLWHSIGREVGEFREGDIRILDDGNSVHITDVDYARAKYIQGTLKGFYPVESFISFESEGES